MGDTGAILNMGRGISSNISDSTSGLGDQIMKLLQTYQTYGQNTQYASQQEQANRIFQTPSNLIGASPSVQSGARNAAVQAMEPTISGAASLVNSISKTITDYQQVQEKTKSDARAVLHDIISNYSASDIRKALTTNPDEFTQLLKNSGYPKDFLSSASTYKEQQEALKVATTAGTGGTTGIGTTGSPEIDTSLPGYSTKVIVGGLTQAAIDQNAQAVALGLPLPVPLGLGSAADTQAKRAAINNRSAELSQGTTIASAKSSLKANQIALDDQTKAMNNVQSALNAADSNFQQVLDSFSGSNLNPSSSTIANKSLAWIRRNITGGNQFSFDAGIQEVKNDYAIVFSRGGQVTDQARGQADKAISDKISFADLKKIHEELQSLGMQIVQSRKTQIDTIQKQISNPFGTKTQTTGTDRVTIVSPDGKTGTIPASQLQKALSQGYKQK